jgi:alkaline phosphatase
MKSVFTAIVIACTFSFAASAVSQSAATVPTAKNIIMVVGDGMGPAYTSAYRYFKDDPSTIAIEQTVFDRHLKGLSSTHPAAVSGYVTDSAAGATALATGIKSFNGAIAVDVNKQPVETVLEWAKKQGKRTGVVVTSQINHATPAGYLAHNESRENYNAIADSYFDQRINGHFKFDLALGGGWKYFIRKDRNLVQQFQQAGFQYIDHYAQLTSLEPNKPTLGLFANKGLPWALDDTDPHRLRTMTQAATKQLENEQGFFMLIEASQIDWGGHSNDISAAMAEMDDLAKTLEYLESYLVNHPDTLVIITADHSTGGLTLAANGVYQWQPEILRNLRQSIDSIAKSLTSTEINVKTTQALFNTALTEQELTLLNEAKHDPKHLLAATDEQGNPYQDKHANNMKKALYQAIKQIINDRTHTGWTSGGHTAIDVPVMAFGAGSEAFCGLKDNTEIANTIFKLLGKA